MLQISTREATGSNFSQEADYSEYGIGLIGGNVEIHLSGLIGTARHPVMQKIRIIGFLFENRLHWLFEFRLLLFTVCTCV